MSARDELVQMYMNMVDQARATMSDEEFAEAEKQTDELIARLHAHRGEK